MSDPLEQARQQALTPVQKELARHALGLPNKKNISWRNHFCSGVDCDNYADWQAMVQAGYAIERTAPKWSSETDRFFHLTLKGALLAREPKEHLSPEDTVAMRALEGK